MSHSKWLVGAAVFLLHQFHHFYRKAWPKAPFCRPWGRHDLTPAPLPGGAVLLHWRKCWATWMTATTLHTSLRSPFPGSQAILAATISRFWNVNFRWSSEESISKFPSFSWGQLEFRKRRRIWMIQSVPASTFGFMHMHSWMMFQVLSKFGRLTFQHVPRHGRILAVAAFVLRRLGCVLRCLAAACIWMSCLLHSSLEFFLACSGHVTLFGLTLLDLQRMLSILGCCPTVGLAPLNGNGIMVILACGLTSPLRVTPDRVNMSCVMLGVLGVCVGTWLRTGVILSLIVLMVVGISGVLTGMLLDCLLRRARLLVRWFAVLLFPQLLSVVGSLLTLPPLAFGTTAPNLARLIMLLGNVSIVLVLFLNLPSFCLLGMVGLWRIRVLTLLWCKVGWSRCNSQSGLLCTSKWRLCSFAWSGYLACFGFARVHPPLRLSRFRWLPLGVPWVVRFSLASPWVWLGLFVLGFRLFLPPVVSGLLWGCLCLVGAGRLRPPDAMEWLVVGAACCWRGRFWLLALLLLPPQLLCAVQLGAVQIKIHTHGRIQGRVLTGCHWPGDWKPTCWQSEPLELDFGTSWMILSHQ